jgi:primosomal protein N' (replication factor Y)
VGSLVRVPLGGRRVRGWVVAAGLPERDGLKAVLGRSGDLPVFDVKLLQVLRWAAAHYVAPFSSLLAKATPPNLPKGKAAPGPGRAVPRPSRLVVGPAGWGDLVTSVARTVADGGGSGLVVAPTIHEGEHLAEVVSGELGTATPVVSSQMAAADVTRAWVNLASKPGTMVVGTREVALWPMAGPGTVVVAGEGRIGLKDKATPTVNARDVLLRRATVERLEVIMTAVVPSPEALERARSTDRIGPPWGLVEVVDRRGEPPGRGLFAEVTAGALRASADKRVLLFTHRRSIAQRCVKCRAVRRCGTCGSNPGGAEICPRCGAATGACSECGGSRFETLGAPVSRVLAEAARIVGREEVGTVGSGKRVVGGTERDLPGLEVDLTVVVDGDGPLMAPSYRAGEDGLRMLGRAVAAAGRGRGRRAIVQTADPDHPAMAALRDRDPIAFIRGETQVRRSLGFPPGGEVIAVEVSGLEGASSALAALGDRAEVHGPAETASGLRWLIQGADLTAARVVLRSIVSTWREGGARVRVDADPLDL